MNVILPGIETRLKRVILGGIKGLYDKLTEQPVLSAYIYALHVPAIIPAVFHMPAGLFNIHRVMSCTVCPLLCRYCVVGLSLFNSYCHY